MSNRIMLAPLTNQQSNADGTLGDDEFNFLTARARGGFGLVMTCASHVQVSGQGFPGQLGIWSDKHLEGLSRLASALREEGSLSAVQLQHAGRRSPPELIGGQPLSPFDDPETGARALTTEEVEQLVEDFILAGLRAEAAGFDGVELHGAHGYMLCAFLDAENNRRDDRYGGSFENRCRMLFEIIEGLRHRTRAGFQIGVRLSPERFGIPLAEAKQLAERVMTCGLVDYLDMSLWDVFKEPAEPEYAGTRLIDHFASLPRGTCRLGVAGKLMDGPTAQACLDAGADFVLIGRAAILHGDFPQQVARDSDFQSVERPVSRDYLESQSVSPAFVEYLKSFQAFVKD